MAQKLKTILSELATDIKSINADDKTSFRYLHSKFNSKIEYFLRLEARSREILKDKSVWKTIDCQELIDVNANTCGFIDYCKTLKRTKDKIPEAYNTNYGQLVKVLTLDGRSEFTMIKSNEYSDYTNREFKSNKAVFWLEDKYVYVPDTEIQFIKIMLLPKNSSEVEKLNCPDECNLVLESEVSYPDYLITLAKQEVLKEISNVYKRTIEDEKADNNTNIKN